MNWKEEDFALDIEGIKNFESLKEIQQAYPKAKVSKDYYCPQCGKHTNCIEDTVVAQSKLKPFHESEEDFHWYEVYVCSSCKEHYIIRNQNF